MDTIALNQHRNLISRMIIPVIDQENLLRGVAGADGHGGAAGAGAGIRCTSELYLADQGQ